MKISAASRTSAIFLTAIAVFAAACDDDGPVGPGEVTECTTAITEAQAGTFVQLCELDSPVRHVRIDNVRASATHASAQIIIGTATPPESASGSTPAGQFKVLFYGGGVPAPPALVQASFGPADAVLEGDASFINAGATVCFDLYDGSSSEAPAFILWVTGQKGANCNDRNTLTLATAYGARAQWGGATGAIAKQAGAFFRHSAGSGAEPTVTLYDEAVLDAADIAASTSCEVTWAANTDWQQLCTPAVGSARHVRLESVASAANNSYFYAVFGQDPDPTGNPSASDGKLILTGGRAHDGSSWTWFRFGSGSTTQFHYASGASALYTDAPSTICFDRSASGTARLVFWASGANGADCAQPSTLTVDNALYDSSADEDTGAIWNAPFVTGKLNFVKTNNVNSTLGKVVVSSEPAAL